jgi:hypothetical protein
VRRIELCCAVTECRGWKDIVNSLMVLLGSCWSGSLLRPARKNLIVNVKETRKI